MWCYKTNCYSIHLKNCLVLFSWEKGNRNSIQYNF